jgi:hypothetical protein
LAQENRRYPACDSPGMTMGRVTRCALLIVPLFVCAGRLHAQHGAPPAGLLQEVNRCLSLVRATSKRRLEQERSQKIPLGGAIATDHGAALSRSRRGPACTG